MIHASGQELITNEGSRVATVNSLERRLIVWTVACILLGFVIGTVL